MSTHDIIDNRTEKLVDHINQSLDVTVSVVHPSLSNCSLSSEQHASETAIQIQETLDAFDGEISLKRLFWQILSYDRVREQLPLSLLPPSVVECTTSLEVFAATEAFTIVLATVKFVPLDGRLEQMAWAVKRHIPNCVVLLHDSSSWLVIFPDEKLKPRVRMVPLPGPAARRTEIVIALTALNAADETSGQELSALELAQSLDESFPGATPNIGDILTEFERIAQHPDPQTRELWPLMKVAGQYPLLTPAQELGKDLRGDETVPDGTDLAYQEWRLVMHNLRLVVWVAYKLPRVGMDLADFVQEGTIGLMKAAKRFDPGRGYRFSTYAVWWIRQAILRALHNNCNLIRWPVWVAQGLINANISGNDQDLNATEKIPVHVPWRLRQLSSQESDPFESALTSEVCTAVLSALAKLKPRQAAVIGRRYGIIGDTEQTLDEIGRSYGLTRERIRQIEVKASGMLSGWLSFVLMPHYESVKWHVHNGRDYIDAYDPDHLFGLCRADHSVRPQLTDH